MIFMTFIFKRGLCPPIRTEHDFQTSDSYEPVLFSESKLTRDDKCSPIAERIVLMIRLF